MHMRKRPWTDSMLEKSPLFIENPREMTGRWNEAFAADRPMELEVGCGKCVSTAAMARDNPEVNYLAVDESRTILGIACRDIGESGIMDNLRLTWFDVMQISQFIAPSDHFRRIHINFCNPWTQKSRHHKRRLTHTRQLTQYKTFLCGEKEIWFKTDDVPLFTASIGYFKEAGFEIVYRTDDLHASGFSPNYVSEHERMYTQKGVPIHFLIAKAPEV